MTSFMNSPLRKELLMALTRQLHRLISMKHISTFTFLEDMEGYLYRGEGKATVATKRSEGLQPRMNYQKIVILFFLLLNCYH